MEVYKKSIEEKIVARTTLLPVLLVGLISATQSVIASDVNRQFRLAVASDDVETVRELLSHGTVDVNAVNKFGKGPLMIAVENGNREIVSLLLDKGADVSAKTSSDQTPLIFAAENEQFEFVTLLLERGANIHDRSRAGLDALMIAAQCGTAEMVRSLLVRGANVYQLQMRFRFRNAL